MVKIDIEKYLEELESASSGKEMDLYSLKDELSSLENLSGAFDSFEKEASIINIDHLKHMEDLSLLLKIKNLASQIKDKKRINKKLHTLHFNLNLLKNKTFTNDRPIKDIVDVFLHNDESKIDMVIDELNDFKTKLEDIKKHHSKLLPKGLDNKIEMESKYGKHIEKLQLIHQKQKSALVSTIKLFVKYAKRHIRNVNR